MEEFFIHNQFKESEKRFRDFDPHLKRIKKLPFKYCSSLINEPSFHIPGVYLITGGRQVGKTTFIKQFILELLSKKKISPDNIFFLTGELIDSHHLLRRAIEEYHVDGSFQYLFIDEVNYIPDWDKAIKYLADAGFFEKMSVVLTGSDSRIIRTAMKRFAGRRGRADKTDFVFYPISFKEYVCLKDPNLLSLCSDIMTTSLFVDCPEYIKEHNKLDDYFYEYVLHGGYLPAISDYFLGNSISKATCNTYIEWIIGDVLKFNKSEHYLREVLKGIWHTYGTQVSWNNLAKYLSIDHHKTVADYCQILEEIHVLSVLEALNENRLTGAPKKNKKIYFCDPFIFHAVGAFIENVFSFDSIKKRIKDTEYMSKLVETVVIDHCKRMWPTYYIKGNKGEVDISIIINKNFYPIEVKWTKQLRTENLKQIKQYKNGIVLWTKSESKKFEKFQVVPLVRFLLHIDKSSKSKMFG